MDAGAWRSGDRGHAPRRAAEYYRWGNENGIATIGPISKESAM